MKKVSDKRTALLQAALELFAENGLSGSTTADIAKRAGVASGTLFLYFRNKDELIAAVYEDVRQRLASAARTASGETALRERFILMLGGYLQFFLENPNMIIFCERYHFSKYRDTRSDEQDPFHDLTMLLRRAREEGVVKNLPDFILASIALAPLVSIARERLVRDVRIDTDLADRIAWACWDALRA